MYKELGDGDMQYCVHNRNISVFNIRANIYNARVDQDINRKQCKCK